MRIDYALVPQNMMDRVISCEILGRHFFTFFFSFFFSTFSILFYSILIPHHLFSSHLFYLLSPQPVLHFVVSTNIRLFSFWAITAFPQRTWYTSLIDWLTGSLNDVLGEGKDLEGFLGSDHCPVMLTLKNPWKKIHEKQGNIKHGF